ncbi:MAG: hypothetical protein HGGPFJEG_03171 [Ignavibacteria bacterium]|nr:hypothetical protein [Ignavibacteria bacterium]
MKHLKLLSAILFTLLFTSVNSFSQDMNPPAPVQNEIFEAMIGTSTADVLRNEKEYLNTINISWDLNHQFLILNLKAVNKKNSEEKYQGMGIWGIENDGTIRTWWFDIFGVPGAGTGTGKINGSKIDMIEKGKFREGTTILELTNDGVNYHSKGVIKTPDGKEIPYEETTVYHKNKQ